MCLRYFLPCLLVLLPVLMTAQEEVEAADTYLISEQKGFREMHPQITADGKTLYFTRGQHPRNQGAANSGDIWLRQLQADGSWGRALNAGGPINSFAEDQLLGLSADGHRLAVLRTGLGNTYFDILERGERSWRIIRSERLDDIATAGFSATFDLATNELVYSRENNGQFDLFQRFLSPTTGWTAEQPLNLLNSAEDEKQPYRSPDGESLYFRRNGKWQVGKWLPERSVFGADRPLNDKIAATCLEICMAVTPANRLIASMDKGGEKEQLFNLPLAADARPVLSKILHGTVGRQSATPTQNGLELSFTLGGRQQVLYPDKKGNYSIVVPATIEEIDLETPGYFLSVVSEERTIYPATTTDAYTSNTTAFSRAYYERERHIRALYQKISATTDEVAMLKQKRAALSQQVRQEQLLAGEEVLEGYIDPELSKLRSQIELAQYNLRDTISPDTLKTEKPTIRSEENAKTMDELTALRNRFIAAQRARTGEDHNWKSADPVALRKSAARQLNEELIPTISRELAQGVYAKDQIDSLAMEQNIRSSLFSTQRKAVYEREAWENELVENIDPKAKQVLKERLRAPIEKSVREDELLQLSILDQQAKLKRYQDSLQMQMDAQFQEEQRAAGVSPATYSPPVSEPVAPQLSSTLVVKGGQVDLVPFAAGQTITLGQLRFGPNSAMIKPGTEQELDRIANQLKANPNLKIEIGVHGNGAQGYLTARELTTQRANRIMTYLTTQGVSADRLTAIGYGKEHPIADNATLEGRLKNQRVEIRIF